jgi:hypothetical protein
MHFRLHATRYQDSTFHAVASCSFVRWLEALVVVMAFYLHFAQGLWALTAAGLALRQVVIITLRLA